MNNQGRMADEHDDTIVGTHTHEQHKNYDRSRLELRMNTNIEEAKSGDKKKEFDRSDRDDRSDDRTGDRSGSFGNNNEDVNNSMSEPSHRQMFPPRSKSPSRQGFLKRNQTRKPLLLHKMRRSKGEEKVNIESTPNKIINEEEPKTMMSLNIIESNSNSDTMNENNILEEITKSTMNQTRSPQKQQHMARMENRLSRLNKLRRRLKHPEQEHYIQNHRDNKKEAHHEVSEAKETSNELDVQSKMLHYLDRKGLNNRGRGGNSSEDGNDIHDIVHDYTDQLKNMRKSPILNRQQQKRSTLFQPPPSLRSVAEGIPEVHFIGEISKGFGFFQQYPSSFYSSSSSFSSSISCKWKIEWGDSFSILAGESNGQTQYSLMDEDVRSCIWNHPMDLHFASASMKGWPRIIIQLWELDKYGRTLLIGFGFTYFPCTKGIHNVIVQCWKPRSLSFSDVVRSFFLGTSTHPQNELIVFDEAWQKRHQIFSTHVGQVSIRLSTILRYFEDS